MTFQSAEPVLLALALTMLLAGVFLALIGAVGATPAEFWDRPLCWLRGHRLDRYISPTTFDGKAGHVYRCSRCLNMVTVIGARL